MAIMMYSLLGFLLYMFEVYGDGVQAGECVCVDAML